MLRIATLFLALCTTASAAELESPSSTTSVEFSAERDGVRVVPGDVIKGEVVGVIDAPLEAVLAVVLDCDGTADWFPATADTRSVGTAAVDICAGTTSAPWPVSDRTWQIEVSAHQLDDGTWVVPFDYVEGSGNIQAMRGGYHLRAMGDKTAVAYEGWLDLGLWLPEFALRWGTKTLLGGLLDALEHEASLQPTRVASVR
ncbi:MAG: hypothetical protein KC912_16570 [Proteobacteria bacterium]|nr:hypothetical protein [Pseudomonadota bacterium]